MVTANLSERLELDGIPLSSPAWEVTDLTPLWDVPDVRGGDQLVPYRRGLVPFRRSFGGKRVDLPITIVGDVDPDGAPAADGRAQLWANRNQLITDVVRPLVVASATGERTLRYYAPDGNTYAGPCQLVGGLRPTPKGPVAFVASLSLVLTEGGLRSETEVDVISSSAPDGGFADLVVPNAGTDYQDDATLELTGTATSVTLTNLTADPGGTVYLTFGGSLGTLTTLDTGAFIADRDGSPVIGLVSYSGFERWLPLVPGNNTIRIEPTGGTATLRVRHFPIYV